MSPVPTGFIVNFTDPGYAHVVRPDGNALTIRYNREWRFLEVLREDGTACILDQEEAQEILQAMQNRLSTIFKIIDKAQEEADVLGEEAEIAQAHAAKVIDRFVAAQKEVGEMVDRVKKIVKPPHLTPVKD